MSINCAITTFRDQFTLVIITSSYYSVYVYTVGFDRFPDHYEKYQGFLPIHGILVLTITFVIFASIAFLITLTPLDFFPSIFSYLKVQESFWGIIHF